MEALFKKYFWIVKLLGLTVAIALAASALTTRIGASTIFVSKSGGKTDEENEDSETEGDDDDDESSPGRPATPRPGAGRRTPEKVRSATDQSKMLTTLTGYNLFCPTCAPEPEEELADGESGEPGEGGPLFDEDGELLGGIQPGEQRTSLPFKLVVTMESSIPKNSQATIFDTETGSVSPYWPGDQVRSGVYLVAVERGLIHLQNNSSLEYLELGDEIPPPKKKAAKKEPEKPKAPPKGAMPGAEDAIKCDSESSCVIERAFVEQILSNPAALAKQARVVPSVVDGETRGFKFYGIRAGSLPKLLGLNSGDMITSVNGKDLKSMDDAMALYTKLRNAPNLSIVIDRKGEQMTKEITIR